MTGNNGQGGAASNTNNGNDSGRRDSATTTASANAEISAMHDFIAGGVAGSASVIVGREFFVTVQHIFLMKCSPFAHSNMFRILGFIA